MQSNPNRLGDQLQTEENNARMIEPPDWFYDIGHDLGPSTDYRHNRRGYDTTELLKQY